MTRFPKSVTEILGLDNTLISGLKNNGDVTRFDAAERDDRFKAGKPAKAENG